MTDKSPSFDHNISLEPENFRNVFTHIPEGIHSLSFQTQPGLPKSNTCSVRKLYYIHITHILFFKRGKFERLFNINSVL